MITRSRLERAGNWIPYRKSAPLRSLTDRFKETLSSASHERNRSSVYMVCSVKGCLAVFETPSKH